MNSSKKHRNFTVVVGSGGIKPLAAIPFLLFLEEYDIEPNLFMACSGGCYISGFWANGMRGEEAIFKKVNSFVDFVKHEKLFNSIDYRSLLSAARYPFGKFDKRRALIYGDTLLKMYKEMSDNAKIEDLPIKTIFQAIDIETGDPVFLEKGDMGSAIYASSAMYPVLPPIEIDGRWLVDGGYYADLPIIEAAKRSDDVIIALVFDQTPREDHTSFLTYFTTFISQVAHSHSRVQNSFAVNLHHQEIIFIRYYFEQNISIWDVDAIPMIIETGNKVIAQKKQELLDILFGVS